MEPDFIAQTAEPMSREERFRWFRDRAREFSQRGATWTRFSHHPDNYDLLLVEAWKYRPDDEGEPRFALTEVSDA